jgi:hypothetical protein
MDDVQKLLAIEEIKALKARYFRAVDTRAWAMFEGLFTPDALFDISDDLPGCVVTGAARIRQTASTPLTGCVSVHHGHCPEIELTSENSATGIWPMEDMLRWHDGSNSPIRSLHGYGHYFEQYERIDGRWFIKAIKLTRLRVDIEDSA